MWLSYGDKKAFFLNDQKRPLHQSLLFCCKQESFIFKRCSPAQIELLFVKQKDFQESSPIFKEAFSF